jgi:ABC-type uncharacterized transport system permease subunit
MTALAPDLSPAAPDATSADPPRRFLPRWATVPSVLIAVLFVLSFARILSGVAQLTSLGMFESALLLAMPIALTGLGGLWAERAGVVNIGLEGMMILGTWFGAYGSIQWGPWQGVLLGVAAGALGGLIHAFVTVTVGVDHIVSGVAINLLALGATDYLTPVAWEGKTKESPAINAKIGDVHLPGFIDEPLFKLLHGVGIHFGDWIDTIRAKDWFLVSDLANLVGGTLMNMSWLVFIALLAFPLSFFVLWKTPLGLRIRSTGEDPDAADSLGVRVYSMKYLAVTVSGAMAGLGGVLLIYLFAGVYSSGQTGGRGYIGLAAMIFGNWQPGPLLAGAGLFGFMDAIQSQVDATGHAMLLVFGILLVLVAALQLGRRGRLAAAGAVVVAGLLVAATVQWDLASGVETAMAVVAGLLALGAIVEAVRSRATAAAVSLLLGVFACWYYSVSDEIPGEFLPYFPHITTLLVLAFSSQHLRMPAADGKIWRRSG